MMGARQSGGLLILMVLIVLLGVVFFLAGMESVPMECARLGYPQSVAGYCSARIDGTDVVLTLEEARRKPRR